MKKLCLSVLLIIFSCTLVFSNAKQDENQKESMMNQEKEILFWYAFSDAPRSGWIQDRIDEWNAQNPGFTVKGENKGSYRETLQSSILAARQGEGPHLVHIFEVGSQLAVDSGIFKPIGEIGGIPEEDYIAPVLNYYTIDGQVNSIPFNSSSPIMYINNDKMLQAGLDPENPPQSFSEIIAALEQARDAGVEGAKLGFCLHSWYFEQWMSEQNAPLVNHSNGRSARADEVLLTSDAAFNILNWMQEMKEKDLYTYTGKMEDWSGSDAIFTEGQAMFHITSTADLGNISAAVEGSFNLGTAYFPIPDGVDRNGTVIGGGSVWVLDDHPLDEQEAARDFILYMTNPENMVSWHKLTGYYPVRNSSVDLLTEEGWFEEFPIASTAFNQLLETKSNDASAGALMGSFLDTRTIIEEAMQKVLQGADVETALKEAKVLADDKLTNYNANL